MRFWFCFSLLLVNACALQRYDAQPVSVAQGESGFLARAPHDAGVRAFLAANGVNTSHWPLARWSLHELTLLAFYYHPDLDVARAYWDSVRAGSMQTPAAALGAVNTELEHHSRREDGSERVSPWTLGIAFDIAFTGTSKRAAQQAYAQAQAQLAHAEIGAAAWRVRSVLRARLLAYYAAQQRAQALAQQRDLRRALQVLLEKRARAGAASHLELSAARVAADEAQTRVAQAHGEAHAARIALGQALGVPSDKLAALQLDLGLFATLLTSEKLPAAALQRTALWQRSDIHQALLAYELEDKRLKVELSKQYPDFVVSPGFSWDQDDNVWRLGWNVGLPLPKGNVKAIAEARAQRQLQARRLTALQAKIIGELEQTQANHQQALLAVTAAQQLLAARRGQVARVEKQLAAGYTDRLALMLAQLEAAAAVAQHGDAVFSAQDKLGALEDVLQRPLLGAPLPRTPARIAAPKAAR